MIKMKNGNLKRIENFSKDKKTRWEPFYWPGYNSSNLIFILPLNVKAEVFDVICCLGRDFDAGSIFGGLHKFTCASHM